MTVVDILIIYLAFGAPIAVYNYLQNRSVPMVRRCLAAAGTFLFWIPAAVQTAHLYISNAYFGDAFVSPVDSDSAEIFISDLRETLRSELVRSGAGIGMHDARETVDRYVGLAGAVRQAMPSSGTPQENLFEAAGRRDVGLSVRCINIRNRRRLERHHAQSRAELLKLLTDAADSPDHIATLKRALKLASQLDDGEMFEKVRRLMAGKAEVWNTESKQSSPSVAVTPVR
jgi:hypothetical protein